VNRQVLLLLILLSACSHREETVRTSVPATHSSLPTNHPERAAKQRLTSVEQLAQASGCSSDIIGRAATAQSDASNYRDAHDWQNARRSAMEAAESYGKCADMRASGAGHNRCLFLKAAGLAFAGSATWSAGNDYSTTEYRTKAFDEAREYFATAAHILIVLRPTASRQLGAEISEELASIREWQRHV
jgi:hypothetical protein